MDKISSFLVKREVLPKRRSSVIAIRQLQDKYLSFEALPLSDDKTSYLI